MNRKHAIVIGASMAGLGTARVLANHFEQVTIIERDILPTTATSESRPGAPQGSHVHALLASGYQTLDIYFPGMMDDLVTEGATRADLTNDFMFYLSGARKLRAKSDIIAITCTRPCLETKLAQYVRALRNVTILQNHNVLEPIFDVNAKRIKGVRIEECDTEESRIIEADLVIDASGRGSQSPKWLASWGYEKPPELSINIDLGYTSCQFERQPGDLNGYAMGAGIAGIPPISKRSGVVTAIEGNKWLVTLCGRLGDYPAADLEAFREFARSLPSPEIYELIKDRVPVTPFYEFRFPAYRRLHYEKMSRFPASYLVIGDALCNLNPVYGQGMSVALSEVKALEECLAVDEDQLDRRFFTKASEIIASPWAFAVSDDLLYPEVEGDRPPAPSALMGWYMARFNRATTKDPIVMKRFFEVANLLAPSSAFFTPKVIWRVLLRGGA